MAASRFHILSGAALAASLASATLLAGCGEHHVGPAQEASAPVERPDALAGAPPEAAGPPPAAAMDAAPPPPAFAPPPPERPGDRDVVYDLGPVVGPHDTMAPIPNPPETAPAHQFHRPFHASAAYVPSRRPHRVHGPSHVTRTQASRAAPASHARTAPAHVPPHAAGPVASRHAPTSPAVPAHSTVAPAARRTPAAHGATPPTANSATGNKAAAKGAAAAGSPAAGGDRGARLGALQTTLKVAVAKSAVLTAPDLKPGQAADVTLALPADFAATVRDAAAKQGLADAAASVNMTALLAGDGYAVAPDETQSQPLTVGQPTEFHWTVTAQPGARGPLHADMGADLLGGGDEALQLGSVSPAGHGGLHVSPRAWGAALLVLLAVLVFGWLSRGGQAAAARRPVRAQPGLYQRPLDMDAAAPPPATPESRREV